jgi:hypothetical protein
VLDKFERILNKQSITWCYEDVQERAKENGKRIGKKKAIEILEAAIQNHDATVGITWESFDYYMD